MKILEKENLDEIVELFKNGSIIAFPTDTVFGLGCLYTNKDAERRIYAAKNRPLNKKLPIMVSDKSILNEYFEINSIEQKIINKLMPGALTIILKIKNSEDTIAIRIPNDSFIIEMLSKINSPLYVTSANLSGEESLFKFDDVYNQLDNRIDAIVRGDANNGISSTIVMIKDNKPLIIRQGPITLNDIERVINE